LLPVQRLAGFWYKGTEFKWNVQFFSPHVYQCAESLVLLTNHKPIKWWNENATQR